MISTPPAIVNHRHTSSAGGGDANASRGGTAEKNVMLMRALLSGPPDGHLSHLQHNIQTQRDQQGLYGVPQHAGERLQAPEGPSVCRQSQEQHPEDPRKRQDSRSNTPVSYFKGRWYKYLCYHF